jgi:hypothetical protein
VSIYCDHFGTFCKPNAHYLQKPNSRYEPIIRCGDLRNLELLLTTVRKELRHEAPGLRRRAGFALGKQDARTRFLLLPGAKTALRNILR